MTEQSQSSPGAAPDRGPRMVQVEGRSKTFPIIVGIIMTGLLAGGVWWVVREKVKRAEAEEAAEAKGPTVEDPDKLEAEIRDIQRTIPREFRAVQRHERHITVLVDHDWYSLPASEKRRFITKVQAALRADAPGFNVLLQDYYTGDVRVTIEAARFKEH